MKRQVARTVNGECVIEYEDQGPASAHPRAQRGGARHTPSGVRLGGAILPLGSETGHQRLGRRADRKDTSTTGAT